MEENYFDPERFRVSLNSFIQEARNVTFILQKNKKEIPRFEEWYAGWQDKLKADRILRWIPVMVLLSTQWPFSIAMMAKSPLRIGKTISSQQTSCYPFSKQFGRLFNKTAKSLENKNLL